MFDNIKLEFEPGFNIILGDNGVGKTTILEADVKK
jgi:recombinational DNA repair ATPase RecF